MARWPTAQLGLAICVVLGILLRMANPQTSSMRRTSEVIADAAKAMRAIQKPVHEQVLLEGELLQELRHMNSILDQTVGVKAERRVLVGSSDTTNAGDSSCTSCRVGVSGKRCLVPTETMITASDKTLCGEDAVCVTASDFHTLEATASEACYLMDDRDAGDLMERAPESAERCGMRVLAGTECSCGADAFKVPCGAKLRVRDASCDDICGSVFGRRPPSTKIKREPPVKLSEGLFESFATKSGKGWESAAGVLYFEPPAWEQVKDYYKGTGIVLFSGGERFLMIFLNALYLRTVLGTTLPIQLWRHDGEGEPVAEMEELATQYEIEFFKATNENGGYAHFKWEDRWEEPEKGGGMRHVLADHTLPLTFKPIPPLLSRFETVIFFDDDAVAIEDPIGLLRLLDSKTDTLERDIAADKRPAILKGVNMHTVRSNGAFRSDGTKPERYSAVFYRDIWSIFRSASIWKYVRWPTEHPFYTAQDSGVFIISKATNDGEGYRGLATAAYMSVHHKVYYPAVYRSEEGYTAIGAGDKDMFQVAWLAKQIPFRMMGPMFFVGRKGVICGHSMGQPDETGQLSVIHFNGFKFRYKHFMDGLLDDREGMVARVSQLSLNRTTSVLIPNCCDGVSRTHVMWESPKCRPPETFCLRFRRNRSSPSRPAHIDWDFEEAFLAHIKHVYTAPYLSVYIGSLGELAADAKAQGVHPAAGAQGDDNSDGSDSAT